VPCPLVPRLSSRGASGPRPPVRHAPGCPGLPAPRWGGASPSAPLLQAGAPAGARPPRAPPPLRDSLAPTSSAAAAAATPSPPPRRRASHAPPPLRRRRLMRGLKVQAAASAAASCRWMSSHLRGNRAGAPWRQQDRQQGSKVHCSHIAGQACACSNRAQPFTQELAGVACGAGIGTEGAVILSLPATAKQTHDRPRMCMAARAELQRKAALSHFPSAGHARVSISRRTCAQTEPAGAHRRALRRLCSAARAYICHAASKAALLGEDSGSGAYSWGTPLGDAAGPPGCARGTPAARPAAACASARWRPHARASVGHCMLS